MRQDKIEEKKAMRKEMGIGKWCLGDILKTFAGLIALIGTIILFNIFGVWVATVIVILMPIYVIYVFIAFIVEDFWPTTPYPGPGGGGGAAFTNQDN